MGVGVVCVFGRWVLTTEPQATVGTAWHYTLLSTAQLRKPLEIFLSCSSSMLVPCSNRLSLLPPPLVPPPPPPLNPPPLPPHRVVGRPLAVSAQVIELDPEDQGRHPGAVQEFRNATHWPKHLLVHYVWRERKEEDEERGLLVLLSGARGGSRGRGRGWVGTGLMCCCLMQRLGGE